MNAGEKVLDFLYGQQLQVDEDWAVKTPNGFTWWAAGNAQTVEILDREAGPDGMTGYLVGVRTEMLADLELTDAAVAELNEGPMRFASMSGPVYDAAAGTVSLCSLARVHDEIGSWMGILLSSAAVLQLGEAQIFGPKLAEALGARPAVSGHPDRGVREEPDDMAFAARMFVETGTEPLRLSEKDFDDAVADFMMRPPSVGASGGGLGLTVEFPYGDASSLCQFIGEQSHPLYGNGLLIVQRFPHPMPAEDGGRLALDFNRADLAETPAGYGFGSYVYTDEMICFNGFIPNALLQAGLLPSLYYSCAARASSMSARLLGREWDEDSFSLDHSAAGRASGEDPNRA